MMKTIRNDRGVVMIAALGIIVALAGLSLVVATSGQMSTLTGAIASQAASAFYAADAVLMPPNHPLVSGKAAIQGFLQGLIDAGATGIRLDTQRIAAQGDLAWARGAYTLSMTPPGGAPVVDTGKYIVCYRRQPAGAWRAVADIFNSDGPAG